MPHQVASAISIWPLLRIMPTCRTATCSVLALAEVLLLICSGLLVRAFHVPGERERTDTLTTLHRPASLTSVYHPCLFPDKETGAFQLSSRISSSGLMLKQVLQPAIVIPLDLVLCV